jgi:poly-gamma-glutamate biosynthesis protein PgsC/CapC
MHNYAFDLEAVRLAIVLGVVISALFYERVQITSGGMIVPSYLVLFLPHPMHIAMTLATAYATYYIVNKILAQRFILYGRRKYEIEILIGLGIIGLLMAISHYATSLADIRVPPMQGVGYLIPAILAHDIARQGSRKTYVAVGVNVVILGALVYSVASLMTISPEISEPMVVQQVGGGLGYPVSLLLPALFVSVIAGMAVFRTFNLRTGGFITGAYVAFFLTKPADLLFVIVVAILTYYVVTGVISKHILMFGRRKLSMMILVGGILGWSAEIVAIAVTRGQWVPWDGFQVMTLMVPALIANDAQRQGMYRTVWGSTLTAVAVFTVMNVVAAALLTFNIVA